MQLKYRGIAYTAPVPPVDVEPTTATEIYRGIPFQATQGRAPAQPLGVTLTYRGNRYSR
jgi:hypothetical protein